MSICMISGHPCHCSTGYSIANPDEAVALEDATECPHARNLRLLLIKEVLPLLDHYAQLKLAGQEKQGRHTARKLRELIHPSLPQLEQQT